MLGKSIWIWCKKRLRRVHPHQPRQKAQPSARTEDLGPSPSFHPEPPTTVETTPSGQPTTPVVAEDVEPNRRLSGQHLAPGNGGSSSNPGISSVNNPTTIGAQFSEQQQIVQTQHTGLQNIAYQINHMDTKLLEGMSPYIIPEAGIYSSMRDPPPMCHPGTRTHILADIRNRINSGTRMIWIHGPAGVGKSAIMQTVAKAMSSQAPCAGLFLSRYGDPPRNDSKKVFVTLAYSLAVDNRSYRQYIEEKLSNDPAFLEKSISEQFMDLFLTPFIEHRVDAGSQRWVVLLDGLDESKNENNDQCMIVNLIRDSILDYAGAVPFIWVIASRPEAHLMIALMKAKQNFRDRPAEFFERTIPVESDAAAQDIERYLHAEFAKIREMHPDSLPKPISTWPSAGDFLKVAEASSGLFVLASTMMKYISVDRPASRLKLIVGLIDRSTLHPTGTPFSSLDITYTQIVSEIPKGLLPVTNSLLSYFHLIGREGLIGACNVLGLSQDEAYDALRQLHSVLTYPPPDIAEDNGVEFFHASFPDFLFSPSRSQNYYVDLNQELTHIWWCYVRILKESYQTNSAAFISHDHVDIHWLLEDDDSHIDKLQRELLRKAQHGWVHLLIEYGHSWCTSCPQSKNDRRLMVGDNELIDVFQSIHPVLFSGNEFPVGMFVDWLSDHAPKAVREKIVGLGAKSGHGGEAEGFRVVSDEEEGNLRVVLRKMEEREREKEKRGVSPRPTTPNTTSDISLLGEGIKQWLPPRVLFPLPDVQRTDLSTDIPRVDGFPKDQSPIQPPQALSPVATAGTTNKVVHQLVRSMLNTEPAYKAFLNSKGGEAQMAVDIMQKMLDRHDTPEDLKRHISYAAMRLCAASGTYPQILALTRVLCNFKDRPIKSGGFADIHLGNINDKLVCLKVPKLDQNREPERYAKDFARETMVWSRLTHPNLLPFYGIYRSGDHLCLVSPWKEDGNISDYLKTNPEVARLPLVFDILAGLGYLHEQSIVHGDLKAANILISSDGSPCLADFGLSSVMDPQILRWSTLHTMTQAGGTIRWEAPELMDEPADGKGPKPTFSCDVYSLASVMYEILTGEIPFYELSREATVILRVIKGITPTKPTSNPDSLELTDEIWRIMERCWKLVPNERPSVDQVTQDLRQLPPTELTMQRIAQNDGKRQDSNPPPTSQAFRAAMWDHQRLEFSTEEVNLLRKYNCYVPQDP